MLKDILITLMVAASIPIGQALYFWTKEEIDWVKKRCMYGPQRFVPFLAGIPGAIQALFAGEQNFGIVSLILVIACLAFGSFAISDSKKDLAVKNTAEATVTFLAIFAAVYLAKNFVI